MNPTTAREARKTIYGRWAGNPKGTPYKPDRCAYRVYGSFHVSHQCVRKPGHGPAELYCKQHAKKVEK